MNGILITTSDFDKAPIGDNLRLVGYRWKAHDYHLKVAMGFQPQTKWPDEGVSPKLVGNVTVWVISKGHAKAAGLRHRALCACPNKGCVWMGSAGRLHQHQKVHK